MRQKKWGFFNTKYLIRANPNKCKKWSTIKQKPKPFLEYYISYSFQTINEIPVREDYLNTLDTNHEDLEQPAVYYVDIGKRITIF